MVSEYNLNMKLTMQKCHKLIYLVVLALFAASCSVNKSLTGSKGIITPLSDKTVVSEGSLVYGLPLTVVDVEIEDGKIALENVYDEYDDEKRLIFYNMKRFVACLLLLISFNVNAQDLNLRIKLFYDVISFFFLKNTLYVKNDVPYKHKSFY